MCVFCIVWHNQCNIQNSIVKSRWFLQEYDIVPEDGVYITHRNM